jgi:tetratricopeptide (TPR) repeat protein
MGTIINHYIFKALENYPYDLEETMEALHYALSYDEKNTMALTIIGKVYAEQLFKYEEAIHYFQQALAENVYAFEVYEPYLKVLLWNEDYTEAEVFINYALTIKGSDKAMLYLKKANLYEHLKNYKKALRFVKEAKSFAFDSGFISNIEETKTRIISKLPKKKKSKKIIAENSIKTKE